MKRQFLFLFVPLFLILTSCVNSSDSVPIDMQRALTQTNVIPIAVIGSGPAGLMASIYGARGGKPTYVFEGNKPGGLLMETTLVENWPGETSIQGPKIIEKLRTQAEHQGVQFIEDAIESIDVTQWPYKLTTENEQEMFALSVVIATGANPRKLGVPGEETYWGSGVTSCAVCDAPFFNNEEVVVIGGGDSAVEEAIQLAPYAKKITILVRKDYMRAATRMQERLSDYDKIRVKYNVEVQKVLGDGMKVTGVELYNNKSNSTTVFPTSGVFLAIGHEPNSSIFRDVIQADKNGYIIVKGRTQQTSVAGVFAAGDVQDNRYRQAGSSAGDGTNAGLDAVQFLDAHGYTPRLNQQLKVRLYDEEPPEQTKLKRSMPIQEIAHLNSVADFDVFMGDHDEGVVVLDFWGNDCPSCIQMTPIFKTIAKQYTDKAAFAMVDVNIATDLVEKLFVHKVPCFLVFKDGALVARYSNMMSRKEFSLFIDQFLSDD